MQVNKQKLDEALDACRELRSDVKDLADNLYYINRQLDDLMCLIEDISEQE